MSQLLKFGFVLGIICLIATLVLAVTYEITRPKIEAQLKKEEQAALKEIIPNADYFDAKSADGIQYFEAVRAKNVIGYCLKITATGYCGYIRMIAGIDTKGVIKGISVLEQYETPGLGARIVEVKTGEGEPWFLKQFKGKIAANIYVQKDINAITGATISSKAVTDAVRDAAKTFFAKLKATKDTK